jgi:hypothetical protein
MNDRRLLRVVLPIFAIAALFACASSGSHSPTKNAAATPAPAAASSLIAGSGVANSASLDASQKETLPAVNPEEKKKLLADLKKTFASEEKNFQKQDKAAMKDFVNAQSANQKVWRGQEKKLREAYFEQHQSGPERRQYVQDYLKRKTAYDQTQKDEVINVKKVSKDHLEKLRTNQVVRETQFKQQLDQNLRPAASLGKPDPSL